VLFFSAVAVLMAAASPAWAAPAKHNTIGDSISLSSVSSPDNDQGDLSVVLWSSSTLTTATVHIYDSTGTTDLLDPAVTETSGVGLPGQTTWTVTTPVTESQLPLGDYLVVVDAADDGGTTITGLSQAWDFIAEPVITFTADHTDISLANPTATLSGNVSLVAPDGTSTPYQGPVAIDLDWGNSGPVVQTDANGDFSLTVSPNASDFAPGVTSASPAVYAVVTGDGYYVTSSPVTFNVTIDPTRLAAGLSSSTVTYGTAVTLSGSLSYQPGATGAFVPETTPTKVVVDNEYGTQVVTGTTNVNGNFSIVLPRSLGNYWTVLAGTDADGTSLLGGSSVSKRMNVTIPTSTSLKVSLNQYWTLAWSGCVNPATNISGISISWPAAVTIQWAGSPSGPWHNLAKTTVSGTCGHGGAAFSAKGTAPQNYAYYRAEFTGQGVSLAGPGTAGSTAYKSSTSGTALAWKYADRITGLSVSPTTVSLNGKITARGQLQYWNNKAWHDYSGQTIYIIFHDPNFCRSSTGWCYMVTAKTNSSGKFSATFSDYIDSAPWAAEYDGNSTHLSAGSPGTVYVKVG
jgi:hypothetical protein